MRTANKDTTLPFGGGTKGNSKIFVRSGQNVVFSSYSMHQSHEPYGIDAAEFRPERWARLKVNDPSYVPFHIGPRACPGRKSPLTRLLRGVLANVGVEQYALIAASYTIVRFLQAFPRLISRDERVWKENINMTLENGNGVLVSLFRDWDGNGDKFLLKKQQL